MDPLIDISLNFEDDIEYFFTFLTDRFEHVSGLWASALSRRFGKKFAPIWVLCAKQSEHFSKQDYVVVNKRMKVLMESIGTDNLVLLQDYEDLNREFCESPRINELIGQLVARQGRVFVLPFTSANLFLKNSQAIILGPDPKIATAYDSKIEHLNLFNQLNLPRNNVRIYGAIENIKKNEKFPFYISAAFTSGGNESGTIYEEQDLDRFYAKLRLINKENQFIVADLIEDFALSPNVNAIVIDEQRTEVICIADQILRKNQYLGNIYPSKADNVVKEQIVSVTKSVGSFLGSQGFKGIFGLDFIIGSDGVLYTVDLNPRRQGGYLCNVLMSSVDIVALELALALGDKVDVPSHEGFQANYAWAHSKIKPYYKNMRIVRSYKVGDYALPFDKKGLMFKTIFYPAGSLLIEGNGGYCIVSGDSYEEVERIILQEVEATISKDFELYEGLP